MNRWQTIVLFAILTGLVGGISYQGVKMLVGLWTIEVYKEGVKAGISSCPTAKTYGTILPTGADKVIHLEIAKT